MAGPQRAQDIEDRFESTLADNPRATVAALRPNGLFCPMPASIELRETQTVSTARAGIELVSEDYHATVLEQFRQLPELGASEIEVELIGGGRARYALFDIRQRHGVMALVISELGAGAPAQTGSGIGQLTVKPRSGRVLRTDFAEFLDADDGVLGMLGYTREAFAALDTVDAVHPEDYQAMVGQWFDLLGAEPGSSRRVRVRYLRSDGSWLWVEITVTQRLDDPAQPHMISDFVDISEEMAAVEEVWRSRELLHRLTETLPVGVLQIDRSSRVVHSNDRLLEVLQVDRADTLERQFASLPTEERSRLVLTVQATLDDGSDADVECHFRRAGDGGTGFAQVACRSLRGRDDSVTGAILCVTDVTDSTRLRMELERRASLDMLTGCLNRATAMAELGRMLAQSKSGTAVAFVDLDRFKPVNDRLGHAAGDALLRQVADTLRGAVRGEDRVGRIGGDEFVVLCPDVATEEAARQIGERVRAAIHFDASLGDSSVPVQASIGVAWTRSAVSPEELVNTADEAMYRSKRDAGQQPIYLACP